MRQKIVARFLDSKEIVKGYTHDFFPTKDSFHVERHDAKPDQLTEVIQLGKLKALFFVKTFEGDTTIKGKSKLVPLKRIGRKVRITFKDGEQLIAYSENYHPDRKGFFAFPLDILSNNEKLFVVNTSVASVKFIDETPATVPAETDGEPAAPAGGPDVPPSGPDVPAAQPQADTTEEPAPSPTIR